MQGLLAVRPNRSLMALLWPSCVKSEMSSLVLPLLLAPNTAKSAQVVLVGLPSPSVKTAKRSPRLQDFADQVFGRKDAAGAFAGQKQPAGLRGSPRPSRGRAGNRNGRRFAAFPASRELGQNGCICDLRDSWQVLRGARGTARRKGFQSTAMVGAGSEAAPALARPTAIPFGKAACHKPPCGETIGQHHPARPLSRLVK